MNGMQRSDDSLTTTNPITLALYALRALQNRAGLALALTLALYALCALIFWAGLALALILSLPL